MHSYEQIALVDFSHVFRRYWHAQSASDERNAAADKSLAKLERINGWADHVIVCLDSPPYTRAQRFPDYKGTRQPPTDELKAAYRWVLEQLEERGFRIARHPGAEADDCIATLATKLIQHERAEEVWIFGHDKDLFQLVSKRVYVLAPKDDQLALIGPDGVEAKMGIPPRLVGDYLALLGDSADNIPGVPGCGPKTAVKLLQEHGSLHGVLEAARHSPNLFTPKLGKLLVETEPTVREMRGLIVLEEDLPLDLEALLKPRHPVAVAEPEDCPEDETVVGEPVARPAGPVDVGGGGADLVADSSVVRVAQAAQRQVPTAALAVSWDRSLEPVGHKQLVWTCQRLAESGLYPLLRWQGIYALALKGRSLGMGLMDALDNLHLVEGRPALGWQAIVAYAIAHPDCEYFRQTECTATSATWETKRRQHPEPTRRTYTIEQARLAGLVRPRGPWEKHPDDMCSKTAAVKLARVVYPDTRALGLYCPEELGAMAEAA